MRIWSCINHGSVIEYEEAEIYDAGVVLIERVYVVDLSGELLDESCARKIKSLTHRMESIQP